MGLNRRRRIFPKRMDGSEFELINQAFSGVLELFAAP
jgi:hypothetical protein